MATKSYEPPSRDSTQHPRPEGDQAKGYRDYGPFPRRSKYPHMKASGPQNHVIGIVFGTLCIGYLDLLGFVFGTWLSRVVGAPSVSLQGLPDCPRSLPSKKGRDRFCDTCKRLFMVLSKRALSKPLLMMNRLSNLARSVVRSQSRRTKKRIRAGQVRRLEMQEEAHFPISQLRHLKGPSSKGLPTPMQKSYGPYYGEPKEHGSYIRTVVDAF